MIGYWEYCPDCKEDRIVTHADPTGNSDPEGAPLTAIRFTCGHAIQVS